MTTLGKGNRREVRVKRSPEKKYAIIEDDVAFLLQESIYIPCTLDLCVPSWTYDALLTQSQYK